LFMDQRANEFIPDTEQFITRLLGEKGAYSYLSGFFNGR
ncbi:Ars, partial [Pasteurella multocida subsp. multocida str. Anand1_cattle]